MREELKNWLLAEDAEDIAAFEERANEPLISFSEMLKRLKKDGSNPGSDMARPGQAI